MFHMMTSTCETRIWILISIFSSLQVALWRCKGGMKDCMCILQASRAQLILKTDIAKLNATNKGLENKLKCGSIVEKNKDKDLQ